jgi:hypothetical protein
VFPFDYPGPNSRDLRSDYYFSKELLLFSSNSGFDYLQQKNKNIFSTRTIDAVKVILCIDPLVSNGPQQF